MGRRLRIVVADDEFDTREYFELLLSRLGHDVRAAADGRQAVEASRAFAPDLLVLDYAMPGLDGLAAAAEVNRGRPVPVILFSGRHDVESPARAAGSPVIKFLAKPVNEAELTAAVESVAARAEPSLGGRAG
jgi:CheY-like chemotaxis protein